MADIKITLETLYDILRNEKKRDDLQKMEVPFFVDVVNYLNEKGALLKQKQESSDIFAVGERDKLEYELRSIKRIVREIYEKREKKIIDIALNRSRTASPIIDTTALLHEEKELYERIVSVLDLFRQDILGKMLEGSFPEISSEKKKSALLSPETTEPTVMPASENASAMTRIRFIRAVPSFVWKDMKEYGPFDPGEEIEIYPEVADLIVRKGRAVKV